MLRVRGRRIPRHRGADGAQLLAHLLRIRFQPLRDGARRDDRRLDLCGLRQSTLGPRAGRGQRLDPGRLRLRGRRIGRIGPRGSQRQARTHVGHGSVGRFAPRLASAPERRSGRRVWLARQHRRSPQRHPQRLQRDSPSRESLRAPALQRERRDLRQRSSVHSRQPRRARRSGCQLVDLPQPDPQRSRLDLARRGRRRPDVHLWQCRLVRRQAVAKLRPARLGCRPHAPRHGKLRADLRERMQQESDGKGLQARAGNERRSPNRSTLSTTASTYGRPFSPEDARSSARGTTRRCSASPMPLRLECASRNS